MSLLDCLSYFYVFFGFCFQIFRGTDKWHFFIFLCFLTVFFLFLITNSVIGYYCGYDVMRFE